MVVAAGAAEREAEEGLADVVRDVVKEELPGDGSHRHSRMLPRAGSQESGRNDRIWVVWKQLVAGDLLQDELVVRLVLVKAPYDIVAVAPSIRPFEVIGVAGGVRIACHIQPVPTPLLSVAGGVE